MLQGVALRVSILCVLSMFRRVRAYSSAAASLFDHTALDIHTRAVPFASLKPKVCVLPCLSLLVKDGPRQVCLVVNVASH